MPGDPELLLDADELPIVALDAIIGNDQDLEVPITRPEYHHEDDEVEAMPVEYSVRAPEDWVISGPLGEHGRGPGRPFPSIRAAELWVRGKYGTRVRWRIPEATRFGGNRWAWLIKGEKHVRSDSDN